MVRYVQGLISNVHTSMNKLWLVVGVVVILGGAFVILGRYQGGSSPEPVVGEEEAATEVSPSAVSSGPVEAVEAFFALLAVGNTKEAYQAQAAAARVEDSEVAFAAAAKGASLTDYVSGSWTEQQMTETEATVEGIVRLKGGRSLPLLVTLVQEGGAWKVRSVGAAQ